MPQKWYKRKHRIHWTKNGSAYILKKIHGKLRKIYITKKLMKGGTGTVQCNNFATCFNLEKQTLNAITKGKDRLTFLNDQLSKIQELKRHYDPNTPNRFNEFRNTRRLTNMTSKFLDDDSYTNPVANKQFKKANPRIIECSKLEDAVVNGKLNIIKHLIKKGCKWKLTDDAINTIMERFITNTNRSKKYKIKQVLEYLKNLNPPFVVTTPVGAFKDVFLNADVEAVGYMLREHGDTLWERYHFREYDEPRAVQLIKELFDTYFRQYNKQEKDKIEEMVRFLKKTNINKTNINMKVVKKYLNNLKDNNLNYDGPDPENPNWNYKGSLIFNCRHGKGILSKTHSIEEGNWVKNMKHGKFILNEGKYGVFEGTYKNDYVKSGCLKRDYGTYKMKEWDNLLDIDGEGTFENKRGDILTCEWRFGKPLDIDQTYKFAKSGEVYKGDKWRQEFEGSSTMPDGTRYEGTFIMIYDETVDHWYSDVEFKRHGKGKLIKNGEVTEAEWENGEMKTRLSEQK